MKGFMKRIGSIIIVLTVLASSFSAAAVEADYSAEYQLIIERWEETIIGSGELDLTDGAIAYKVNLITSEAQKYWDSLTRPEKENPTKEDYLNLWLNNCDQSDGDPVFNTKDDDGNIVNSLSGYLWKGEGIDPAWHLQRDQTGVITNNFERIRTMALAYRVGDVDLKGNAEFLKEILYALEFLCTEWYAETTTEYGNWWDWNVGIPIALTDTAVLLRDDMSAEFMQFCVSRIACFTPHTMKGANLNWRSSINMLRGALLQDSSYLDSAKSGFEKILTYVTESDGFYESDGSFKQHNYFAYIGSYGGNLYKVLSASLVALSDTPWDISDETKEMIIGTVKDAVEPLLVNGQVMEMVYGRSVAASGSVGGYSGGRMIVNSLPVLANMAEGEQAEYIKSLAKEMLTYLTSEEVSKFYDYYASTDIGVYLYAKEIINDDTIAPFERTDKNRVFYNMDRVVQHNDNYSLGLAVHSTRTGSYEQANGNNTRGWYQASGTLFVYNDDLSKYSDHYWYTTDFWRMPGATSLYGVEMTSESGKGSSCGQNPWAGGTELGDYTIASMLMHPADMTLNAKKSYFMFDNEVVALGAGITSSDDAQVETTIENIKLSGDGSNKFIIDGEETVIDSDGDGLIDTADNSKGMSRLQNSVETTISKYAHISGNTEGSSIGYYFPEKTTIQIARENRKGYNFLINPGAENNDYTEYTREYLKMYYSHGLNAEDSNSYSYVLLPGATAEETAVYSESADVEILSNTEDVQAVYDKKLNMTGITFWNNKETTVYKNGAEWITSNGASSVMVSETENEITIAVSDPTQLKTDKFCIEINAETNGVSSPHADIAVLQHGEKTIIEVNPVSVVGNKGETKTITLTKGEYVSDEEPVAPVVTGETFGTKEGTALSKYVTTEGTRPLTFTTDCTVNGIEIDRFGSITVADTVPVGKYTFNVTATNTAGSSTDLFTVLVLTDVEAKSPSGSVVYYTFNEGYGTTINSDTKIKSSSSQNMTGVLSESVEWVDGFVGTGVKFDSIDDTLIIEKGSTGNNANSLGMQPTQSTFAGATEYDFWVKFDIDPTTSDYDQWIISKGSKAATNNIPWAIKVTNKGEIAFLWNQPSKIANWVYSDELSWNVGEWYHITLTHNKSYEVVFERDGVSVGKGTTKTGITDSSRQVSINGSTFVAANSNQYFNGTIDELYLGKVGGGEEIRLRSKVSFVSDCSADISPQYVDLGKTAIQPEKPIKEGYIFIGWFADKECTEYFDFSTKIYNETVVYAGFVDADSEYSNISSNVASSQANNVILYYGFNDGYGNTVSRIGRGLGSSYNYNAAISDSVDWVDGFVGSAIKLDAPEDYLAMVAVNANHYGMIGMDPSYTNTSASVNGNKEYDFWIKFNEDLLDWKADQIIIARDNSKVLPWAIKVTTEGEIAFVWSGASRCTSKALDWKAGEWYHINVTHSYDSANASPYAITIIRDGITVGTGSHSVAKTPTGRAMYINGYKSNTGLSTGVFTDGTQYFNGSIDELYLGLAGTAQNIYVRHKVSFDTMGGNEVEPQYVWKNGNATEAEPTKDGYIFAGWYADEALTSSFDFGTAITADTTLYAKWEEDKTVAEVEGVGYETLKEAITNADGKTVTLLKDVVLTEKIDINNTVTLDLSGFTLTSYAVNDNYDIVVNGSLTIIGDGTVNLSGIYGIGVIGSLTVENGTFNHNGDYLIGVWGNADINGGTFNSAYCAVNGFESGMATVNGGVFNGEYDDGEYTDILIAGNVEIKGGIYDRDVTDYLVYGYGVSDDGNGNWTAYKKNIIWGDASGDGIIDAADLVELRKILLNKLSADESRIENYDANGDKVFNIKDLVRLKKYIAGIVNVLGPA